MRNAGVAVQSYSLCLISKRRSLDFPLLPPVSVFIYLCGGFFCLFVLLYSHLGII